MTRAAVTGGPETPRTPYVYSQEQARRYHRKVRDLSAKLAVAENEASFLREHDKWLNEIALRDIGTWLGTSYATRHSYGMCLEFLARTRVKAEHRYWPAWIGVISMRLTGNYMAAKRAWNLWRAIVSIPRFVLHFTRHA